MTESKRQHYVPKTYLRQFALPGSSERAIRALRLKGWQHFEQASIETACQRPFFMGATSPSSRSYCELKVPPPQS